ncbi:ABC transporter ATP-binding protein [Paenibacillus tyrfis]|uniref:ABC transporter ATP-binding protein n=1 Tax=Paenibacillus tyrfis TaxID=1501230 RepID=UPI00068A223F|nr:energy-coupling factor transporter ATPase [Paenibacillus tyrfis]
MNMIEVEGVTFRYDGDAAPVLRGATLTVRQGETVLLLGASGSGKSTLALTLNGLIPHAVRGEFGGQVRVGGLDTKTTAVAELACHVGMVFQDPESQLVTFTVEEEVVFGLENLRLAPELMERRMVEALRSVGLLHLRKQKVERLSGGQKQRLAIASVLAMRPRVLVFDEPTAQLDPAGRAEVFDIIGKLSRSGEYTIVLIEHHLDECVALADRVVVLGAGGVTLCEGSPRNVFRDHYERLWEEGIWLPSSVRLCRELGLSEVALTVEEMAQLLLDEFHAGSRITAPYDYHAVAAPPIQPQMQRKRVSMPALEVRPETLARSAAGAFLRPFALTVPAGGFFAIVGENGAGKTTFALHLIRMLPICKGVLFLSGREAAGLSTEELVREAGFVFQNPEHQFVTDCVEKELSAGMKGAAMAEEEVGIRAAALMRRFGLEACAAKSPYQLSQGQKRRLSVATMLATERKILLLDEPTFGQDRKNAEEMMRMLQRLQSEGVTIILITHDLSLVAEYADHVAVLSQGHVRFQGSPGELFQRTEQLAEAGLRLPPAAALAEQLAHHYPQFRGVSTYTDLLRVCTCLGIYATRRRSQA